MSSVKSRLTGPWLLAFFYLICPPVGGSTPAAQRRAGILYEVWHSEAANLMRQVAAKGGAQLTTEGVIRSNGSETLDSVYKKYGLDGDIWNVQPQLGFYCLYRQRADDPSPPLPDCKNITKTASAHAAMLVEAGFDYVTVDITNWPQVNPPTDIAVLRPTEVLFEEWLRLRQRGTPTPQIAVWPCSPNGANTWQYIFDHIYNNDTFSELVYRMDGKKVVFLPDNPTCYDPSEEALIRSNGGRNDVVTIRMWALFGAANYQQGSWGFFSPCTVGQGTSVTYTTSMVGVGPCAQFSSIENASVAEVSASGSYMLSQTSLPFASAGHMRGLTLQRLFEKVLAAGAPNLFMSSFNEHIGGRQAPACAANTCFNMGEFSRDIEPTMEGGSRVWEVATSCVQLYKAGATCLTRPKAACCTTTDKQVYANIWSLVAPGQTDYLLTNSVDERSVLVAQGWRELCNPAAGPTVFCVDTGLVDGRPGPFMLFNTSLPSTAPLFRCITAAGQHFFSLDTSCEGHHTESLLGYLATQRGGEMLRGLSRCGGFNVLPWAAESGSARHALDLPCDIPDTGVLGFVR